MAIGNIPGRAGLKSVTTGLWDYPVGTSSIEQTPRYISWTIAAETGKWDCVGRVIVPQYMTQKIEGYNSEILCLSKIGFGFGGNYLEFSTPDSPNVSCYLWRLDREQTVVELGGRGYPSNQFELRVRYSTKYADYIGDNYENNIGAPGLIPGRANVAGTGSLGMRIAGQTFKKLEDNV